MAIEEAAPEKREIGRAGFFYNPCYMEEEKKRRGFQPGKPKTGGRKKGTGGRPLYLTIPPDLTIKIPADPDEARAFILSLLRSALISA